MPRNNHRQVGVPDWENVSPQERKPLQKLAAETRGIVTPGNLFSLTGLTLTALGAYSLSKGRDFKGIVQISIGRAFDVADGWVAHKTETKSPLGEAVDATLDKLAVAVCVPALVHRGVITKEFAKIAITQNLANTALTGIAKMRGNEIHSDKAGKESTAKLWGKIGADGLAFAAAESGYAAASELLHEAGQLLESEYIKQGLEATTEYADAALRDPLHRGSKN